MPVTMEAMSDQLILDNLRALHAEEEKLRLKALGLVARDSQLQLHISVIGNAMNLADLFRQFPTDDEDMKAIQLLGMRAFNAFGSSLKLALSGYGQNSALIMRLILEIVFLLELLEGDRSLIERWRCADEKERKEKFWPAPVRNALDVRSGFKEKKREQHYKLFSEFAGHPTMKSVVMMRPRQDGDAQGMPFVEEGVLKNLLYEMARFAVMFGDILGRFFFKTWVDGHRARADYKRAQKCWREVWDPRFLKKSYLTRRNGGICGLEG